jgi:uncharacterized protein (TIGR00255 family)
MTGFGVGEASLGEGRVIAEVRSVNQRFLDVRARLPRELTELTLFVEHVARERLRRGRVEIVVHTEGTVTPPTTLDRERARSAFRLLSELRDELAPGTDVPLSLLAAVPDLFLPTAGLEKDQARAAIKRALEGGIEAMSAMCIREGEALAADMRARCELLRRLAGEVEGRVEVTRDVARRRLRERLDRLLSGVEVTLDATRIEAEVALLAERGDITEELTRLGSHLDQFADAIGSPDGEPAGRRMEFLLQEMLREANTLGAKAQDVTISQRVVAMKVELERLREQVQNVE